MNTSKNSEAEEAAKSDAQAKLDEAMMAYNAQLPKPATNRALEAVAKVMGEVGSVEKKGVNEFHRYNYATAADVMHKLQPLIAKNGLTILQHQKALAFIQDGAAMAIEYEFHVLHQSGDSLPLAAVHTGVAAARTSKGGPDDKAANKCHTAARKYFLLSLFQIPTGDYEDPDADGEVPVKAKKTEQAAVKTATEQKPKEEPKGIFLDKGNGDGQHFASVTAYLDALETALSDSDDPTSLFGLNETTLQHYQSLAAQKKQETIVARIKAIFDHIHAGDVPGVSG